MPMKPDLPPVAVTSSTSPDLRGGAVGSVVLVAEVLRGGRLAPKRGRVAFPSLWELEK